MNKKFLTFILFSLIVVFNNLNLSAGGVITIEETRKNTSILNNIYIEKHLIRIESQIGEEIHISIFNAEKEILYNIDMKNKSYVMITKDDLEKIGSKMHAVNKILEDKLKDLPKEQREMMNKMMQRNISKQPEMNKEITYSLVYENVKALNWNCDKYTVKENEELIRDVWVTDWSNSGLKDEYKNVLKSMEKFFNYFTDQFGNNVQSHSISLDFTLADKGIPVKTIYYSNGKENGMSIVKKIKEIELPYSLFMVPTEFKKTDPFSQLN